MREAATQREAALKRDEERAINQFLAGRERRWDIENSREVAERAMEQEDREPYVNPLVPAPPQRGKRTRTPLPPPGPGIF